MGTNSKNDDIVDYGYAAWAGFLGGNLSSFVKWGSEIPFPPREAGRISPPFAILKALGLNAEDMTYVFTGHVINYGVAWCTRASRSSSACSIACSQRHARS